tara:strand:- start:643 stop:882 length:240 start_codon:yes stop_codon:yes gene_type:complete
MEFTVMTFERAAGARQTTFAGLGAIEVVRESIRQTVLGRDIIVFPSEWWRAAIPKTYDEAIEKLRVKRGEARKIGMEGL